MSNDTSKYTISYINESPGLVIRAEHAKEVDEAITAILPVFKRFKEQVDKGKEARMKQQQEQSLPGTPDGEAPICSTHGTKKVWKTGRSQAGKDYAFWACPTKNADGSFCKAK